jgi:hypothetical protein
LSEVKVHAHRLRHNTATQLLNAGCLVTNIQKFLGHKKLNTTMVYARAHDQTIEADYFAAMSRIETRLAIPPEPEPAPAPLQEPERTQLLVLAEKLTEPELSFELRLEIAFQMRGWNHGVRTEEGKALLESYRSAHELRCQGREPRTLCSFLMPWQWRECDKLISFSSGLHPKKWTGS